MILKNLWMIIVCVLFLSGCGGTPVRQNGETGSTPPRNVEDAPQVESSTLANDIIPAVADDSSLSDMAAVSSEDRLVNIPEPINPEPSIPEPRCRSVETPTQQPSRFQRMSSVELSALSGPAHSQLESVLLSTILRQVVTALDLSSPN